MNDTITNQSAISVSSQATAEIKRLIQEKSIPADHGLRMGVKGGGCAGLSYLLGFDRKNENDREFEFEGVKIFVEPSHLMYLAGIQLDFQDGLNARGFVFNNPNATKTCGCGTSFSS